MSTPYHHGNLRQELLERAIDTLNEKGIEELSLRALARDLGVSHAAPLRHFAKKTDILGAIAIEGVRSLLQATEVAGNSPPGLRRLRAMAMAYVMWARDNPAFHRVIRNADVMRHASQEVQTMLVDFANRQRHEILAAQANGWRSLDDPDVLFVHLVSLTAGTAIVATEQMYEVPMASALSKETLGASIELFLSEEPETHTSVAD